VRIIEKKFRGSLICRLLDYPVAYAITKMLLENGPMPLDDIVKHVKISKPGVCVHLRKLRIGHIIRYEKRWPNTIYRIKYPKEVKLFLDAAEMLASRISRRIKQDY
jgi:DNA-binding transcriptional regulator GbsR (MarR family)